MKQILFIVVCLLGYYNSSSQPDYLVLVEGDTLHGKVTHLNYGPEQKVLLADQDKKKTVYSMLQVKSFQMDGQIFHLLKMNDRYTYMKLAKPGYLSLYNFQMENQITWDGQFLFKRDGHGIEVPNIGFKKRIADFVSEFPDLAEDVRAGTYARKDLDEIITKYNTYIDLQSTLMTQNPDENKIAPEEFSAWNNLETAVRATEDLEEKENVLEMISEARAKSQRGENACAESGPGH